MKRAKLTPVKDGTLTFGQRIALGQVLQSSKLTESKKYITALEVMDIHEHEVFLFDTYLLDYYHDEILAGVIHWSEREAKELKYDPTKEEIMAGIEALAAKSGYMGTVKALAKAYSVDPDEVLKWKYGKVFDILRTDLLESQFCKRLEREHANKAKREQKKRYK